MVLPYLTAPGNARKALKTIQTTPPPDIIDSLYIHEVMQISGTSAKQMRGWLQKIGLIDLAGRPTALYAQFQNVTTVKDAALQAIRNGYAAIHARVPDIHRLGSSALEELIRSETGHGIGSNVVALTAASIRALADIAYPPSHPASAVGAATVRAGSVVSGESTGSSGVPLPQSVPPVAVTANAMLLASRAELPTVHNEKAAPSTTVYNIYLSLPASSDESVYAAMFRAMKGTLLSAYVSVPFLQNDFAILAIRRALRFAHLMH